MKRKTIKIVGSAKSDPSDERPYPILCNFLEKTGFTPTSQENAEFLIAINHNQEMYKDFVRNGGIRERAILIRLEPDSVFPLQYKPVTTKKYGLVLTPGSVIDHANREKFVGWPYEYNLNPTQPNVSDPSLLSVLEDTTWRHLFDLETWESRPRKLTMIAANKVSPLGSANYSIRRELANQLSPDILEVYGPLWTGKTSAKIYHRIAVAVTNLRQGIMPNPIGIYGSLFRKYPTAHGTVPNKHVVSRETKFSLVVENSNSYVSEKLIDAMINGSIPIYVGPSLEKVGLPREIAIHASGNPKEIIEVIETLDSSEVETILTAMREFLSSASFIDIWTAPSVYKKLAYQIAEHFQGLPE